MDAVTDPGGFPAARQDPLARVLAGIADGVTAQDAAGRLLYANDAAARAVGYPSGAAFLAAPAEEVLARYEVRDESGRPFPADRLPGRVALRDGVESEATLCWRERGTGEERWSVVRSSPVRGEDGSVVMAINVFHDVTGQVRRQRELQDRAREAETARARAVTILESIGDAFVAYDREWRFTYVGARAAELFRGTAGVAADVVGTRLWDAFPGMAGSAFEEPLRRAMAGTETVTFEALGEQGRWYEVSAYPSPEGLSVYFRDVTRRKDAEAARRESEERFRALADGAPVLIRMAGSDARFDFFNRPWLEFTGRTPEQERGDGWMAGVHPDDVERCTGVYLASFEARRPFLTEYRLRRADGEYRWLLDHGVPRFGPDGEFAGFIGSCVDIADRKRAEESLALLAEASELLNRTLDSEATLAELARLAVPRLGDWCAVDLAGADGSIRRLAVAHRDPAKLEWAHEIGRRYPTDPAAPTGVPEVLRTGRAEFYPEVTDEMLVAGALDAEHLEIMRQVGFRSVILAPLLAEGRAIGVLTLVSAESGRGYDAQDLALALDLGRRAGAAIDNARLYREAREARELLEEQAQELEATNEELLAAMADADAARTEAEAANLAKSEFLALMSHELRTPLNAIGGYADLMEMEIHGPVTDAQREALRRIRFGQEHLLGIINDVLNFARLESGHVEFAARDAPVQAILDEVVAMMEPQLAAKGLACECPPGDPAVTAWADPEKVRQILLNLLSNAFKFTPAGGTVVTEWEPEPERVRVRVRDTGIGIPPDKLQAVFDPFVQVSPGLTRETGGTGLGLAISRDLARAMGGDLTGDSAPGEGSTFTVVLPRTPPPSG